MKRLITELNKAFDHRVRLGIMAVLLVNDWVDFTQLRDSLGVTDGNLASHLRALENEAYISLRKQFVGRKPQTSYQVTPAGRKAFDEHLNLLELLLKLRDNA